MAIFNSYFDITRGYKTCLSKISTLGMYCFSKSRPTTIISVSIQCFQLKFLRNHDWLVVWNMNFMTFHMLGMSSSQLTNSIIFPVSPMFLTSIVYCHDFPGSFTPSPITTPGPQEVPHPPGRPATGLEGGRRRPGRLRRRRHRHGRGRRAWSAGVGEAGEERGGAGHQWVTWSTGFSRFPWFKKVDSG